MTCFLLQGVRCAHLGAQLVGAVSMLETKETISHLWVGVVGLLEGNILYGSKGMSIADSPLYVLSYMLLLRRSRDVRAALKTQTTNHH